MKRILSLLLILILLLLSGCGGASGNVVELTHRLIDGAPTWVFDFTYTNTARSPLYVVALEVLCDAEQELASGQELIDIGLASDRVIDPGETYSLYLTTESLAAQPEYTFVLTLRREDNTCFSHVVTYRLTDYDPVLVPETPAQTQQQPTQSAPSSDSQSIPLLPENGTDWHFIMDFLNETGEEILLQNVEIINLMDGAQLDTFHLTAVDLNLEAPVMPDTSFFFEDWHPVVPDFNGRIYRLHFTTASGTGFTREYIFDLMGAGTSSAPQEPVSDPAAPTDALLPVFANDEYHWQFISSFTNNTAETLTFQELHIVNLLDGQLQGDHLLTMQELQHIQPSVEPGQPFVFEDWHPVVDHMDERHYIFVFTTPDGQAVEYPFEFPLSRDTTQRRDPANAQALSLPVIDYAHDDGRDLIALRHDASFSMQIAPDVFWVPAASLGGSDHTNREMYALLSLSPEDKQSRVDTLYEALQLYEISDFTPSDDNVRMQEGEINWEHHKPGYYAVATNTGCCATDSNWLNYILRGDYEEVGFLATSQRDGGGHVYNYIRHEGWYYFIDLTAQRRSDNVAITEDGDPSTFDAMNFGLNGLIRASSLEAYAQYVQDTFGDPPGLMFAYQYADCLALDSVREQHGITILYGAPEDVNVQVIYDDPGDSLYPGFTAPPSRTPDWSRSALYTFPGA